MNKVMKKLFISLTLLVFCELLLGLLLSIDPRVIDPRNKVTIRSAYINRSASISRLYQSASISIGASLSIDPIRVSGGFTPLKEFTIDSRLC